MRALVSVSTILSILLIAPMALATPFQQFGLMSPEERNIILAVAIFLGFIAMVSLLPDFDGTEDSDWDAHGGDDLWRH